MPTEMYRINMNRHTGPFDEDRVLLFTSLEQLRSRLLNDRLQSDHDYASRNSEKSKLSKLWLRSLFPNKDDRSRPLYFYKIEKLVDMEWVEMKVEYLPPQLVISEISPEDFSD